MIRPRPIAPGVREKIARAACWRLLGLLLERPRPGWAGEVLSLSAETDDPRLRETARGAAEATEGTYLAVLGPGGTVSPREVSYRPQGDPGQLVSELKVFYDAFAYHPRAEDPVDHVSVEAGFVGYLLLKEAYALAAGEAEAAEVTARGRCRFLEEHLRGFTGGLARRLENSPAPHLALAARALAEVASA